MKIFRRIGVLLCSLILMLAFSPSFSKDAQKLFIFNWSYYIKPSIIKKFEEEYKVDVVRSHYNSMPALFSKLRAGGASQYDIVVPSNYYVPRMVKSGLLQKLDHSQIPNLDNLKPRFRGLKYDPHNKYTVPYQWGTTGIAYNTEDLSNVPKSWSIIFDPSVNSKNPFSVALDGQVMLGVACAYQGNDYSCTGRKKWKQAGKLLLKSKNRPNFNGFVAGTRTLRQLARGNLDAGMTYNGDYVHAKSEDSQGFANIEYIIPKEGAELWVDNMAIPANAPHPKLAHKFINFILKAEIGAELSNYNYYATPNKLSQPMLRDVLRKPPITPTSSQMKRLHLTPSLRGGQLHFVSQLWTEIKSN
ncbi:spermidine/putrescine ABC transporter substrate-binding protein [Salinisphaera sp. USBA-960]|nr:spermidine/putrescine ABC transporter substrate-binding protein [Salifodinibacter halophilus]NNC26325.1 spermidine/putrescine ABC transporter substrate-binding protein [Salifodinibacter halophilus]